MRQGIKMKANEIREHLKNGDKSIGMWSVAIDKKLTKPFIIGCYFDDADKRWKTYGVDEKGQTEVYIETEIEDEAYSVLGSIVTFERRKNKGYI